MKKSVIFTIAAAMMISMAGCSKSPEPDPDTGISVVAQKHDPDSSSNKDRLTPAMTEADYLTKKSWSDLKFYAKGQDYDERTKTRRYYEGEIISDSSKQQIFEKLCSIINGGEITLKGEQSVQGGADPILTLKDTDAKEYTIAEGILVEHPEEDGGASIYIFRGQSSTLYFGAEYKDQIAFEGLISQGVKCDQNLVRTEKDPDASASTDEIKAFTEAHHSDFRYYSSADDYNEKRERIEYKGEIVDDDIKKQIFDVLCGILKKGETKLRDGQNVGQSGPELRISHENGKLNYVCYEGMITNSSQEAGGESVLVFAAPNSTVYTCADSDEIKKLNDLVHGGVISDKNRVKKDSDIRPYNIIDAQYTDFTYIGGKQTVNDQKNYVCKTYEGEITNDAWKQKIFTELCSILRQGNIELKGEQSVQGGASSLLTLKTKGGAEVSISKGILVEHPQEEGGSEIYIVKFKQGAEQFYGGSDRFDESVRNGVVQSGNTLVKTVQLPRPEIKKSDVKPQFPLTYIKLRTNYAWGQHISGICTDAKGDVYSFDFSKTLPAGNGELTDNVIQNLKDGIANIIKSGAQFDASILKQGVAYAAKISPNAEFSCEHKMCDYGQNTLYAVVDGKAVKLYSKGDNDEFTDDVNAQKAIECFEKTCRKPVKAVAVPD